MTGDAQATIVVVPRERFSYAERSLTSILDHTTCPFRLIYIDAGTPAPVRKFLHEESERRKFQLLCTSGYLSPNQARNLGWQAVETKYTVFLDNDTLVTPGWLEQLIRCAEETGADVVGPLYLIGEIEKRTIHLAGGILRSTGEQGKRILYDEQYLFDTPLDAVAAGLERKQWDYAEFHCMLVRSDLLKRLGPLDEDLLSLQEHIDLGLGVRQAGGSIYIEPDSMTSYIPPPPGVWSDLPYFMLRWSEPWNLASVRHFNHKWGYSGLGWHGDKSPPGDEDTIVRFGRGHRRLLTGLRTDKAQPGGFPERPLEEAELMVALFLSVDRDCFDLTLMSRDGRTIKTAAALDPQRVFEQLRPFLQQAEEENLSVMIRPMEARRPTDPALVELDALDAEAMNKVRPYAFLTLEVRPQLYQSWLAVDKANWRSAAALRSLIANGEPVGPVAVAGSTVGNADHASNGNANRIRFVEGVTGLLVSTHQLDRGDLRPYLASGRIF